AILKFQALAQWCRQQLNYAQPRNMRRWPTANPSRRNARSLIKLVLDPALIRPADFARFRHSREVFQSRVAARPAIQTRDKVLPAPWPRGLWALSICERWRVRVGDPRPLRAPRSRR